MEITYLGHSCFKVVGKKIAVLIDPFDASKVGLKLGKQDADVVLVTHEHADHNDLSVLKNDYLLFDSAGEYEAKESEFVGVQTEHGAEQGNNTIFAFEVDGVKICHLGDLGKELKSDQLEKIDGVDVLMIPVGGNYTIDAKEAVKVIGQIEPKVVLPMHYKAGNMTDLADLKDFLSEMSVDPVAQDKLKLTSKDLPEKLEVVTLKY
jgi:L-ascorbate metabolism protein UlaG (beta-lactamase superfamily)